MTVTVTGYTSPPWRSVKEPELREFLLARAKEGYSFPINPVWPIRDKGWYAVLEALRSSAEQKANLNAWFPPVTGVLDRIEKLHATYRDGFCPLPPPPKAPSPKKPKVGKMKSLGVKQMGLSSMLALNLHDLDTREMGDFVTAEVRGEIKMRWRRVRNAFIIESRLRRRPTLKETSHESTAVEPMPEPQATASSVVKLPPIGRPSHEEDEGDS